MCVCFGVFFVWLFNFFRLIVFLYCFWDYVFFWGSWFCFAFGGWGCFVFLSLLRHITHWSVVPLIHAGFRSCTLRIGSHHCSPLDRLQRWWPLNYNGPSASRDTAQHTLANILQLQRHRHENDKVKENIRHQVTKTLLHKLERTEDHIINKSGWWNYIDMLGWASDSCAGGPGFKPQMIWDGSILWKYFFKLCSDLSEKCSMYSVTFFSKFHFIFWVFWFAVCVQLVHKLEKF